MHLIYQLILILGSFILVYFWQSTELSKYSVPFIGFLVFVFLLVSIKNKAKFNLGGPLNFFLLNTVLLLLIFSTGGIKSALFSILYFLLFASAFIMNPKSVFMFPIGAVIIFSSTIFQEDVSTNLIKIFSLFALTPLAYFFGKQFKTNEKQDDVVLKTKERSVDAADEISKNVEEVIKKESDKLDQNDMQKLNDVLEEASDLRSEKNND